MIVAYIDTYRDRFGVEPICTVLSAHGVTIAPSTYYASKQSPISAAVLQDAYLANALYTLWVENWGVYGARKLWKAARRTKIDVGYVTGRVHLGEVRHARGPDPARQRLLDASQRGATSRDRAAQTLRRGIRVHPGRRHRALRAPRPGNRRWFGHPLHGPGCQRG